VEASGATTHGGAADSIGGAADSTGADLLPPAAVPVWASLPPDEQDQRTELLWSGHVSQPTRVSATVKTLPRASAGASGVSGGGCSGGGGDGPLTYTADPSTADPSTADPSTADLSTADPSTVGPSTAGPSPPVAWEHTLVVNYRGLKPIEVVEAQLGRLRASLGSDRVLWAEGSDLASGEGSQQVAFVSSSVLPNAIEAAAARLDGTVSIKYEPNPGRSDASHLWRCLPSDLRGERIVPFTCGPGHRSHRCAAEGVMRKTHGPNEGFHKETGRRVLPFFVSLVARFPT